MSEEASTETIEERAAREAAAELEKENARTRAEMDACDARIDANSDGTFIIRLIEPIVVDGKEHGRLTLGRVKVRHAREVRGIELHLEAYAERLLVPHGALDELTTELDYITCMRAAERALGKFRAAGRAT